MSAVATQPGTGLSIAPLTGLFGALVEGVDLSREVAPDLAAQIRRAFAEHTVLVFRGETAATPEEQHRLAALFGEPQPLDVFQFLGAQQPSITFLRDSKIAEERSADAPKATAAVPQAYLQNLGIAGEFDGWHSDSTFTPWLPKAAVLRAEQIPPVGGDTGFASLSAAYDALSPTLQSWLSEISAIHIVPDGFKAGVNLQAYGPDAEARFDARYPPREWPLVIAHPETGRKALFVVPGYTAHLVGLSRPESHTLLRFLCRHVASIGFTYRHHWRPGDLVVWDEVFALHRAPTDFAPHERKVVRITAGRQVPTAPA
jgi:taurine dioxygenase